jgi:hypothetical protein
MKTDYKNLIREIKNTVPLTSNLASNIHEIDKFVKVQELIVELDSIGLDEQISLVVGVFKDYFQPIILATLSYEVDFIRVVEPILRTPKIPLHASNILGERLGISPAFSYNSILNKLIEPTEVEKKLGEILFIHNSNDLSGLKNTSALRIALSTLKD